MNDFFGWSHTFDYLLYIKTVIITVYAIILFRVNSSRLFGNHSTLDLVIYVILGAVLGEAIVDTLPLLPSMIICLIIVGIHRALAVLSYKSHYIGKCIKGEKIILLKDGQYIQANLQSCKMTHNDILQALRVQYGTEDIKHVALGLLERSGELSFIFKKKK